MNTWLLAILCLIAAALALLGIAAVRTLAAPKKTARYQAPPADARAEEYARKLSRMVACDTVSHPDGDRQEKFPEFHALLEELFPLVHGRLEKTEIDGNLLFRWKGKSADRPLVLMSHQDVVPAEGEWKHPPFSGDIADGKVWGRGASDTKCSLMAFFQSVEEMIADGYQPKCDVYLASSCTEEIGGSGAPKLANWLKEHGVKLFMLCDEGGSIIQDPLGGVNGHYAAVGIFEKGYGDVKFIARSKGGHASAPGRNTPIPRLAKFIAAVEKKSPFKVQFSPAVEAMFERLAPYAGPFYLRLVMHNLWLFKPVLLKMLPAINASAGAMTQTTLAFTTARGSDGLNVLPQQAYVTGNMRLIHHQPGAESFAAVREIADRYNIETEVLYEDAPCPVVGYESKQFHLIEQLVAKVYPGVQVSPYVMTGGTDAKFYKDICPNCIRFAPLYIDSQQYGSVHGLNENIFQGALPHGVDFYKQVIKKMTEIEA